MIFLTDEEVETLAEIKGNIMIYDGKKYKIVRVTNDGYYIREIQKGA